MNRRTFTATGAGVVLAGSLAGAPAQRSILEIRQYKLRTNSADQTRRTGDFLSKGVLPAMQKAGAGPCGYFGAVIASGSPFILSVTQFPRLAVFETIRDKQEHDPEYLKARSALTSSPDLAFERQEASLLRCFESIPHLELPPAGNSNSTHVFELRRYESNNEVTLARKVKMFNEGEIAIFRRLGMGPVFFGETMIGSGLPNLTYMLAFDSLAARESAWAAFGGDPEWKDLRSRPGNSDAELVSNISNAILRPLAFSQIR